MACPSGQTATYFVTSKPISGVLSVERVKTVALTGLSRRALSSQADAFTVQHQHAWLHPKDPRTIGAAIDFRCMAWIEEGPFLCPALNVAWHYIGRDYDLDQFAWRGMVDKVAGDL